jgi:hypothetical protein
MKMEQTVCSETSAYKIQTPGNYPEENIQHLQHGESLKSSNIIVVVVVTAVAASVCAQCGVASKQQAANCHT